MRFIRATLVCLSSIGFSAGALAQAPPPGQPRSDARPHAGGSRALTSAAEPSGETKAVTQAILEEIDKRSELMANIEYLCDMIGPRLTGSPDLTKANQWTRDKFQQYGLSNAHLEPWTIERAWTRGEAKGRVVVPVEQRILLESAGWSPSTKGPQRGPVVHVKAQSADELSPYKGKLKGAWVSSREVSVQPSPKQPAAQPGRRDAAADARLSCGCGSSARSSRSSWSPRGPPACSVDSNKEHGLINMTGAASNFTPAELPEAFLTTESYGLIWRLLKRGPVEIEIDLKNTFSTGEVEVYNTVAEIPGSEKPDEVVIIGGHIDSWDLGTGATDNGTGHHGRARGRPGAQGRRRQAQAHDPLRPVLRRGRRACTARVPTSRRTRRRCPRSAGVLIHDMGTGRVKSIGLQGRYDLREVMDKVVEPFKEAVNLEELSMRKMMGTDHLSFLPHGVPAFAVVQDAAEYRKTHHTESDTFDKVYPDEINQGAKVLAAWAYNVAMLPDILPRDPKPPQPGMFDSPEFRQPRDQKPKSEEPNQEKTKPHAAAEAGR